MQQTRIQKKIQRLISEFFTNIKSHFNGDELAYLTLQGKNEMQIRDKFAWWLQKKLNNRCKSGEEKYIVRREFSPKGRSKVDLAILEINKEIENEWTERIKKKRSLLMNKTWEMKTYKVIAMIEFKAASFLDDELWIYPEFNDDVKKMKTFVEKKEGNHVESPDLYFIFLHGMQDRKSSESNYKVAVVYKNIIEQATTYKKNEENAIKIKMKEKWDKFYNLPFPKDSTFNDTPGISTKKYGGIDRITFVNNTLKTPDPKIQPIGSSFGYYLYCAPMIWGPIKTSDIDVLQDNKK